MSSVSIAIPLEFPTIFPTLSESHFSISEEDVSLSIKSGVPSDSDPTHSVEYNHDTNVALELNLIHMSTETAYAASLSTDGKYLGTVSVAGVVQIFDVELGKRLW